MSEEMLKEEKQVFEISTLNIKKIGEPRVVMSNPGSKHAYFGWPSAARLQNGKIAVPGHRLYFST